VQLCGRVVIVEKDVQTVKLSCILFDICGCVKPYPDIFLVRDVVLEGFDLVELPCQDV
jgi:hypothetical protein